MKNTIEKRPATSEGKNQRRRRRQTLNGRLPLKHRPDQRQTLATGVSDDPQQFIFRRKKKKTDFFRRQNFGFSLFLSGFGGAT